MLHADDTFRYDNGWDLGGRYTLYIPNVNEPDAKPMTSVVWNLSRLYTKPNLIFLLPVLSSASSLIRTVTF